MRAIKVKQPVNNADTVKVDNASTSIKIYKSTTLIGKLTTKPDPTVTRDSLSACFCFWFII